MSKKIVLVTGGSGLVGRALQAQLKQQQEAAVGQQFEFVFASSRDADLTQFEATKQLFAKHEPQIVLHLAAKVGGLFAHLNDTGNSFYAQNNSINENVLRCAREHQVSKCISCLSTCIFPDQLGGLLDETNIHQGPPHSSNRGYAMAKRRIDLLNREFNRTRADGRQSAPLFTCVVPTNVYGPDDQFNLERSHVVAGLIHRAYLESTGAARPAKLLVFGSGRPLRQFIYAPDLARLLIWLLANYADPEPIILCPDPADELSIGQLAEKICAIFGEKFNVDLQVEYATPNGAAEDGQFKKTASNAKLRRLLPDFQFTAVEVGLRETIDWFCERYPNVRLQ